MPIYFSLFLSSFLYYHLLQKILYCSYVSDVLYCIFVFPLSIYYIYIAGRPTHPCWQCSDAAWPRGVLEGRLACKMQPLAFRSPPPSRCSPQSRLPLKCMPAVKQSQGLNQQSSTQLAYQYSHMLGLLKTHTQVFSRY